MTMDASALGWLYAVFLLGLPAGVAALLLCDALGVTRIVSNRVWTWRRTASEMLNRPYWTRF